MSCRAAGAGGCKEEYERHYAVTETRTHEKGFTEYQVTAQFISKKNPEDVKEIVIWKRYSDFKKLHTDLSYTHRNLFRRMEAFPAFPKAQLFGRFEAAVIEERRRGAETMLNFTVGIPALNNSPELKNFFRGGEVRRKADVVEARSSQLLLPPPLLPEGAELCQNLEVLEDSGVGEMTAVLSEEGENKAENLADVPLALEQEAEEELDLLFDCPGEEEEAPCCPLLHHELALFDPCFNQDRDPSSLSHEEELGSLVMEPSSEDKLPVIQDPLWSLPFHPGDAPSESAEGSPNLGDYLVLATEQIKQALEKEATEDFRGAVQSYKDGVDILLKGMQGDPSAARREAVKKRTAEYIQRAETLVCLHPKATQP
ncbi:sorting nexin-15 isoform X2 [Rhinatrema bivittatum]|uniref:sorting nexin-15 isoform X2 n=1 Tax=Rhinatrema bivittatum TaxID=194408 RepID=UPI001127E32C|nr:sorting nexin-15 isoform X2 [Rhinatrema bivittatum]